MPVDESLSPHFLLSEFLLSQDAERFGLRNEPDLAARTNLHRLALALEGVRSTLGNVPMFISSGFRSSEVNRSVGGAKNSAHLTGRAADFIAPGYGHPRQICQRLVEAGTVFDQLIFEGSWVHFAIAAEAAVPRQDVLTAVFRKGRKPTYRKGIA